MPPKRKASAAPRDRGARRARAAPNANDDAPAAADADADAASPGSAAPARAAPALASFLDWCAPRGIALHPSLVARDVAAPGADRPHRSVFAANGPVRVGDVLCEIPRAWCVSPRHASITSVLPRRALDDLDDAALILTVMYERALGAASPWAPYFAVLPSGGEPLPFTWDEDRFERSLAGTDAYRRVREDEPTMREDHARIVAVCCEHAKRLRAFFPDGRVPPEMLERRNAQGVDEEEASEEEEEEEEHAPYAEGPAGYLAFREAASLVASRAFQLDADGGQGLVPMADMFDHASVDSAHARFEDGDDDDDDDEEEDEKDEKNGGDPARTGGRRPSASASGSESSSPAASLSSDDSNLEAEMSRLNDGAPGETTLEQFERAADDDAAAPGGSKPIVYDDNDPSRPDVEGLDARSADGVVRLVAVRPCEKNDEVFNSFGDHPNALLLHKYGFCERDDGKGGKSVSIAPELVAETIGAEVFAEAYEALEGAGAFEGEGEGEGEEGGEGEGEGEEKDDEDEGGKKESETPGVAPSAALTSADGVTRGEAMARAAGWTGACVFELYDDDDDDDDETLETLESDARRRPSFPYASRDLLLVLATALADPDDAERCDPSTGLPPDLAATDDARLLASDGVAAALLAIVKARGEAVVVGEGDEDEDGSEARGTAAAAEARGGGPGPGPSGVVGIEAAAVLRAQERRVCRRVFDATVAWLRRALEGGDEGEGGKKGKDADVPKGSAPRKGGKAKTSGPMQDTPYGSVTYLPRVSR